VQPRDLPVSISPLRSLLFPTLTLRLPQLRRKKKILERIKMILKRVITEIRRSRAKFEPDKSNFDTTPHYRFGSLEYAREKNIPSKLACNLLTEARCEDRKNFQYAHLPNGSFLNSFLFAHFYLFRCPLPRQENPSEHQ
jgi:hypothetical protein